MKAFIWSVIAVLATVLVMALLYVMFTSPFWGAATMSLAVIAFAVWEFRAHLKERNAAWQGAGPSPLFIDAKTHVLQKRNRNYD